MKVLDEFGNEGEVVGFVGDGHYGAMAIVCYGERLRGERLNELRVVPPELEAEDRVFARTRRTLVQSGGSVNMWQKPPTGTQ